MGLSRTWYQSGEFVLAAIIYFDDTNSLGIMQTHGSDENC